MKKTGICPKCGGKNIAYFINLSSGNSAQDMLGLKFSAIKGTPEIIIEAFVCRKCGYVELYVPEIHLNSL